MNESNEEDDAAERGGGRREGSSEQVGTGSRGRAALIEDGVEFDARDATLLRTVARTGSVAKTASELRRSRARALSRIETLEDAFGELVERRRGGRGGGGSQLTENGTQLLSRYDRLAVTLAAAAQVPETVLHGPVTEITGELATVNTEVGTVRGLHREANLDETVPVRIGADAITVHDTETDHEPDSTSARNRFCGRVSEIGPGETVRTVTIDVENTPFQALVTDESVERLDLYTGRDVVITWKATATRVVRGTRQ